jgi:hypothetical protein
MAAADDQRATDEQADEPIAGEHRLSLAEWLVLCLVREHPAYAQLQERVHEMDELKDQF